MFPKVLIIGSIVLAVFYGGAAPASAAYLHSEGEFSTLKGSSTRTHKLTFTAGELTCAKAAIEGSMSAKTAASFTANATYSECHFYLFGATISATVNMNGCDYVFYASRRMDIVCPAGKRIVVSAAGCTLEIGEQSNVMGPNILQSLPLTFFNTSSELGLEVDAQLAYNHTGFTCGTGSAKNGLYSGAYKVSGSKGKIWWE
jgi:hypothetical protein